MHTHARMCGLSLREHAYAALGLPRERGVGHQSDCTEPPPAAELRLNWSFESCKQLQV